MTQNERTNGEEGANEITQLQVPKLLAVVEAAREFEAAMYGLLAANIRVGFVEAWVIKSGKTVEPWPAEFRAYEAMANLSAALRAAGGQG